MAPAISLLQSIFEPHDVSRFSGCSSLYIPGMESWTTWKSTWVKFSQICSLVWNCSSVKNSALLASLTESVTLATSLILKERRTPRPFPLDLCSIIIAFLSVTLMLSHSFNRSNLAYQSRKDLRDPWQSLHLLCLQRAPPTATVSSIFTRSKQSVHLSIATLFHKLTCWQEIKTWRRTHGHITRNLETMNQVNQVSKPWGTHSTSWVGFSSGFFLLDVFASTWSESPWQLPCSWSTTTTGSEPTTPSSLSSGSPLLCFDSTTGVLWEAGVLDAFIGVLRFFNTLIGVPWFFNTLMGVPGFFNTFMGVPAPAPSFLVDRIGVAQSCNGIGIGCKMVLLRGVMGSFRPCFWACFCVSFTSWNKCDFSAGFGVREVGLGVSLSRNMFATYWPNSNSSPLLDLGVGVWSKGTNCKARGVWTPGSPGSAPEGGESLPAMDYSGTILNMLNPCIELEQLKNIHKSKEPWICTFAETNITLLKPQWKYSNLIDDFAGCCCSANTLHAFFTSTNALHSSFSLHRQKDRASF